MKETFNKWTPLFLISSMGLFLELAVIRWVSAEVRLFSYFKNLTLLAAFLGLAIGFALVKSEKNYLPTFSKLLGLFIGLTLFVGRIISPGDIAYPGSADEFLWGTANYQYWFALFIFLGIILVYFFFIVFLFIPLGQATGREMQNHMALPAYIVNLIASLAGIWLFALLSFLKTSPVIWFGIAILGIGFYLHSKDLLNRFTIAIFSTVLVGIYFIGQGSMWSPYHRLDLEELSFTPQNEIKEINVGYSLSVQQTFYQTALDISEAFMSQLNGSLPHIDKIGFSYDLPYLLQSNIGEALIVGAGMGNDVAAALRSGVGHVDAVEIDPTIAELGRDFHPESPYSDPRVTIIVDDARSFFQKNTKKYDIAVFGLLDSHTLLSGLSNVRLDSFVYTVDSFKQVKGLLNDGGITVVTFIVGTQWIEDRLGLMLEEVFGKENVYVYTDGVGVTFVAGPVAPEHIANYNLSAWEYSSGPDSEKPPLATDNWPYLYLRTKKVPSADWQALLVIGVVLILFLKRSFPEALRPDWHFWLLGAAFLLIEFKSITEMALLFGTTWLVNAFAITGVLLMAILANILVLQKPNIKIRPVYILLFLSLALNYFFPLDLLGGLTLLSRAIVGMALLSLPLFFAGIIFSVALRRSGNISRALGSNLSGAAVGGVLEYGSLIWGIKSLYIIAALVYAGAMFVYLRGRK